VYATAYARLRGNTIVNDSVELKDKRPFPYSIRYLTIEDNFFKNARVVADSYSVSDPAGRVYVIDRNTYDNAGGSLLRWNAVNYTSLSSIYSDLGFEQHGKLGSVSFAARTLPA
jgi:hypothetical protein